MCILIIIDNDNQGYQEKTFKINSGQNRKEKTRFLSRIFIKLIEKKFYKEVSKHKIVRFGSLNKI